MVDSKIYKREDKDNSVIFTKFTKFMKTYRNRFLTSIVLVLLFSLWMFIGAIYLEPIFGYHPQWAAYTFMTINSFIFTGCLCEIINLKKKARWLLLLKILINLTGLFILWFPIGNERFGPYLYNDKWFKTWMNLLLIIFVIGIFCLIAAKSKNFKINDVIFIFTWIFYLCFAFKAVNYLMLHQNFNHEFGWPTILFVLVIVMANDVGAFLGGICYGKNLLAPKISPHKTWEGALTGLVTALILSMTLVIIFLQISDYKPLPFYENFTTGKTPIYIAYFASTFVLSIVSQCGDLLFSYVKRGFGIKDFANILPGHGGLLDRLDSFTAVVIVGFLITLASSTT